MRFELIDRVTQRGEDHLRAVKCVTSAEEYLGDHFPGFPVLPGVLMLEAMVQAGRLLVDPAAAGAERPLVVRDVRNVRYGRMVKPGQTLEVEVTLRDRSDQGYEFHGAGRVDGEVAVQGRFRLDHVASPHTPAVP